MKFNIKITNIIRLIPITKNNTKRTNKRTYVSFEFNWLILEVSGEFKLKKRN